MICLRQEDCSALFLYGGRRTFPTPIAFIAFFSLPYQLRFIRSEDKWTARSSSRVPPISPELAWHSQFPWVPAYFGPTTVAFYSPGRGRLARPKQALLPSLWSHEKRRQRARQVRIEIVVGIDSPTPISLIAAFQRRCVDHGLTVWGPSRR